MHYVALNQGGLETVRLTLLPDEPVLESLLTVAERENYHSLSILEGSSMVRGPIRLGFYDAEHGKYENLVDFDGTYDVVSVAGNIHRLEDTGEHAIHIHMSFANAAMGYAVKGGHVMVVRHAGNRIIDGSRFQNDFRAAPTAEFTLLVQGKHQVSRRRIAGCHAPLILPKHGAHRHDDCNRRAVNLPLATRDRAAVPVLQ